MTSSRPALDPRAVREVLRRAGLRPRHERSQNFLADVDVLEAILAEANPLPGRRILEIGPGLGILTEALVGAGAAVTAVELDSGLVAWLHERLEGAIEAAAREGIEAPGTLRLVEGNALDQDLTDLLRPPYDVVANLPYHITSPVLHRLLGEPPRPERLVLMLQREVAERIAARPGQMSYLSVFVQYHAQVRVARIVPPAAFEPPPKVESAVVVLEPYPGDDRLDGPAEEELWRIVQAAFRERRKMLHNVLARQLPIPAAQVAAALAAAGIDGERRPQTLAVGEWLELRESLGPIGLDARGRRTSAS
jgi:16S rRNA (adenine1518-N6/adenine1519-N6)-dimethyltransferase